MRESIRQFVKICAETLPLSDPLYEFGALQVPGQEGFADMRPFFPGRRFIGADMRHGQGVDILLNLHNIDLPDASIGTVLVLETLEHVEEPRRAIAETHRVLKPEGTLLLTTVMNFPIHEHPSDYWRFTPEGLRSLLSCFPFSLVDAVGEELFPHTVFGIAFKGPAPAALGHFEARLQLWKTSWRAIPR